MEKKAGAHLTPPGKDANIMICNEREEWKE